MTWLARLANWMSLVLNNKKAREKAAEVLVTMLQLLVIVVQTLAKEE
jgi:hypothetical protein